MIADFVPAFVNFLELFGKALAEESGDSESVWMIPLRRDLMPSVIERAIEITAGRIYRAGLRIRG